MAVVEVEVRRAGARRVSPAADVVLVVGAAGRDGGSGAVEAMGFAGA